MGEHMLSQLRHIAEKIRETNRSDGEIVNAAADHIESLEARVRELEAELDSERSVVNRIVTTLGGIVEGRPTHRINVLQRCRQLRAIEADPRVVRLLPEEDRDRIMREGADLAADLYYNPIAREAARQSEGGG